MDGFKIAIIGLGRVGGALARVLTDKGSAPIALASRHEARLKAKAKEVGCSIFSTSPWEITAQADIVFLTVPDDAIEKVCHELVQKGGLKKGACLLHCSGAKSSAVLKLAHQVGASVASLHPLQSFAVDSTGNPFEGIVVSVEGDEAASAKAFSTARFLGSQPVKIDGKSKTLYHAAAVVASNYLVTVLDLALSLAQKAGLDHQTAMNGFAPLIQGTLANVKENGPIEALTGPLARGDIGTITAHINEIEAKAPELAELYRTLGKATLPLVRKGGILDSTQVKLMRECLHKDE